MPDHRPDGYEAHRLLTPGWVAMQATRNAEWGYPERRPVPLPVWLNPAHGPALMALPFELIWATTREDEADTHLAPLLGLPELPFVAWSSPRPKSPDGVFWKTPEVVSWTDGRPFAWLDDEITGADRDWVDAHHPAPSLLLRIDPSLGLLPEDFAVLKEWAAELDRGQG
ncbi:hypothetical protein [Streptacidiphilus sp. P02-A3a]|uniref:hypothetical protein n=1 Tax=Streptacidiphilus sp. P02-A3a TaxID=2704468 RepID=UPI001CDBAE29|nr:hypothetical protein [Streptacidiphilus sp. P02-A3a]